MEQICLRLSYVIERIELELRQEDPPIHNGMDKALAQFDVKKSRREAEAVAASTVTGIQKFDESFNSGSEQTKSFPKRLAPSLSHLSKVGCKNVGTGGDGGRKDGGAKGGGGGGKGGGGGGKVCRAGDDGGKVVVTDGWRGRRPSKEICAGPLLTDDPKVKALFLERQRSSPTSDLPSSIGSGSILSSNPKIPSKSSDLSVND